ncbi:hypothetical protein BX661DRAFT_180666, partial [Kickxella alabastrina]|uniref:uncharacterized protein n=1 Tax=Kickxella alabastrina TaxID=61397 RepID=UPI00221FED37
MTTFLNFFPLKMEILKESTTVTCPLLFSLFPVLEAADSNYVESWMLRNYNTKEKLAFVLATFFSLGTLYNKV